MGLPSLLLPIHPEGLDPWVKNAVLGNTSHTISQQAQKDLGENKGAGQGGAGALATQRQMAARSTVHGADSLTGDWLLPSIACALLCYTEPRLPLSAPPLVSTLAGSLMEDGWAALHTHSTAPVCLIPGCIPHLGDGSVGWGATWPRQTPD